MTLPRTRSGYPGGLNRVRTWAFAALAAAALGCWVVPPPALAQQVQPAANPLGQCLIRSTTATDRRVLVRWAFATMALDPDVAGLAAVTLAQRQALDQQAGSVVTNLLASACQTQAQQAIANGGPQAISAAFEVWGQWAITGLVSQPAVAQGMAGLLQYIDIGKLMSTLLPLPGAQGSGGVR